MSTAALQEPGSTPGEPQLVEVQAVAGATGSCLVWRFEPPRPAVSTAIVGGGLRDASWIINLSVGSDYRRTDPEAHLDAVATELGLAGEGIAMMTAVPVARHQVAAIDGVTACATVGVGTPTWAADERPRSEVDHPRHPGTINVVAQVPADVEPGALVNLTTTITEAKVQALADAGVAGTGTATDATCVVVDRRGPPARFGGPRSEWGSRLALATYRAVTAGLDDGRLP